MFEGLFVPSPLPKTILVRLDGIDTPELHSRCTDERKLANEAKQFVKQQMATARVIQVAPKDWDKYGGRILADVFLDGKSLSQTMLEMGYARPYKGEKKLPWCDTAK